MSSPAGQRSASARGLSARQIIEALPARYDPRYGVVPGVCQFDLGGPGGGQYFTRLEGGELTAAAGVHPAPDCTVSLPAQDLVGWCTGRLRDADLMASGRLRIAGDAELLFSMAMMMASGVPDEIRRALQEIDRRFAGRPMPGAIERVTSLSPAYLREACREKTPFVLAGGAAGWRSASWTLEDLRRRFGHISFPVRRASRSSPWVALFPLAPGRGRARGTMRLGDFIQAILESSPDDADLPHTDLMPLPPELDGEIGSLPVFPDAALTRARPELFFSAAGAYTPLHRDLEDGATCVFVGRRRFRLWSPDQAELLYAMPDHPPAFQGCFADARRPDLRRFPLLRRARAVEVTLEPGDVLYLPFGWFHDVSVLEHGMTIRFDYRHDLHRELPAGPG